MEELANVLGAILGTAVASFGAVAILGWKLWRAARGVKDSQKSMGDELRKALGDADELRWPKEEGDAPRSRRRTGTFQAIVREELDIHFSRLEERIDQRFEAVDARLESVEASTGRQAATLVQLAHSHENVVRRTNEHGAALSLISAEQSTTNGERPR